MARGQARGGRYGSVTNPAGTSTAEVSAAPALEGAGEMLIGWLATTGRCRCAQVHEAQFGAQSSPQVCSVHPAPAIAETVGANAATNRKANTSAARILRMIPR